MMKSDAQTEPSLSPDIVSAWFITVINPLIEDLKLQHDYLCRKNYTWRYRPAEFEVIGRPPDRLPPAYFPNFEHLTVIYPDILEMVLEHGNRIAELRTACRDLQHILEHSLELQKLYAKATADDVLNIYGKSIKDMFGAYPVDDHLAYLAQLIINRTEILPDYYTVHPLWNQFRDEFLSLLAAPGIRDHVGTADRSSDAVREAGDRLASRLESIRLNLAHKYGVPFVPPGSLAV